MAYYETPYPIQIRRKRYYAAALALIGAALPAAGVYLYGFPDEVALWLAFAVAFFTLEFWAVEVNERSMTTPGNAVLVAAGIALYEVARQRRRAD